jgi:hypothetical protein
LSYCVVHADGNLISARARSNKRHDAWSPRLAPHNDNRLDRRRGFDDSRVAAALAAHANS